MVDRRLVLVSAAAAALLSLIALEVWVSMPVKTYTYSGMRVSYYEPLGRQFVRVVVENATGERFPTIVSVYAWLPNGTLKHLGDYGGRSGVVELNVVKVRAYYDAWHQHLKRHGSTPSLYQVGLITLISVNTPYGVYASMRVVPLSIEDIVRGKSVEIRIEGRMKRDNMIPRDHIWRRASTALASAKYVATSGGLESYEWPPAEIVEACEYIPSPEPGLGAYICTYWKLEQVHFSALNTTVPIVIADVHGEYKDEVQPVDHVILRLRIESSKTLGVNVAFGATASVERVGSASVDFELAGFTMVLSDDRVWLDHYRVWQEGVDFFGDTLFAVGFYGDIAYANYTLVTCVYSLIVDCVEIGEGYLALARPVVVNDEMIPWHGKDDYPYDDEGIIEEAYWRFHSLWALSDERVDSSGLFIDVLTVKSEIETTSLLTLTIPVAALAKNVPIVAVIALGASLGVTGEELNLLYAAVVVDTDSPETGYVVAGRYIYSPTRIEYNDDSYYIGTLFVDIEVRED